MYYLLFLVYMGSIALAATAAPYFMVMDIGEVLLIVGISFTTPLLLLTMIFKASERLAVSVAHVLVAIAVHPAVKPIEDSFMSREEQAEVLALVGAKSDMAVNQRAKLTHALAKSLGNDVTSRLKYRKPVIYWAYPPSIVLCVWAVVLFWGMPSWARRTRRA